MKVSGRFLLDTNIIIDFFKGDESIAQQLSQEDIFLSPIVVGELFYGAYASAIVKTRGIRLRQLSYFLEKYVVLEINEHTSDGYGKIKAQLKESGKPIPENDIWIAAIALEHNLSLVTRDKHFTHVKELQTIAW